MTIKSIIWTVMISIVMWYVGYRIYILLDKLL